MALGDGFEIPSQEMPYVILKALSIIIDAAKSDEEHALGLFGSTDPMTKVKSPPPSLLTKWGTGPALTASMDEALANPKSNKPVPPEQQKGVEDPAIELQKAENEKWKYMEFPGEFLYNFQSRYDKQPGTPFSIQVEPVNVSSDVPEIGASVEVWWHNQKGLNKIYVVEVKDKQKSKATLIAKFYDNEVAAKMGATTPNDPNFFTIDKAIQNANPSAESQLKGAPPQVMAEIKKLEPDVIRAFMAVTHRKRMEFKSQGWNEKQKQEQQNAKIQSEMPSSNIDAQGTLSYTDSKTGQKVTMTQEQMKAILKGPIDPAGILRTRLTELGYFEAFPDALPAPATKTPLWKQAHSQLVMKGYSTKKADNLLGDAWYNIKTISPNASIWPEDASMTADEFVNRALKKKLGSEAPETIVSKVPAALDAAKALITLGHSKTDAFNGVAQAMKTIGADKSTEEYIKAATAKPKPAEPQKPAEAPKPAQPAQPPTPKFKEGDTVETGGAKFKIKSISPNNVVLADAKGTEFAVPATQWAEWEKSGAIKASAPNPVSGKASAPAPTAPVSKPASGPAPTTNPTAPVSNAGKQQAAAKAPQSPDVGKLSLGNGKLIWTVGNDVQQLDVAQVKAMLKKAKFKAAVKANPDVYQQFKDKFDTGGNEGGKEKTQEGIEYINPFRWENLV